MCFSHELLVRVCRSREKQVGERQLGPNLRCSSEVSERIRISCVIHHTREHNHVYLAFRTHDHRVSCHMFPLHRFLPSRCCVNVMTMEEEGRGISSGHDSQVFAFSSAASCSCLGERSGVHLSVVVRRFCVVLRMCKSMCHVISSFTASERATCDIQLRRWPLFDSAVRKV